MALPMNSTPVYKINIPSTGKEITFRPFLVKEEKALLLAQQSESTEIMVNTLKEIIKSCVKEPLDVDSLAIFDYEFLFTNIRAKSVGEIVENKYICNNIVNGTECGNKMDVNIDLNGYNLDNPMVVDIDHSGQRNSLTMHHYLPVQIIKKNTISVANNNILCEIDPSAEFSEYYQSTVIKISELLRAKNIVEELSNGNYDDVMDAMEQLNYGDNVIH